MKARCVFATALLALVALDALLAPAAARAQPVVASEAPLEEPGLPAPARAFELTVASGYTQGFGTLRPGTTVPDVAKAGLGVEANAGYRIEPRYSVSLGGSYQELEPERDDGVRAFAWTLALQYHLAPASRLDPWLELGSGYRMLWLVPFGSGQTTLMHGPQLVRLRAGLDIRVSPEVAISPVIGADATMFVVQDDVSATAIADPRLSTFVFAGVQSRIDIH
jgi:hypothetical protein